jgi:hypothetical protein
MSSGWKPGASGLVPPAPLPEIKVDAGAEARRLSFGFLGGELVLLLLLLLLNQPEKKRDKPPAEGGFSGVLPGGT